MADVAPDHETIQKIAFEGRPGTAWAMMQLRLFNQAMQALRDNGFAESPETLAQLETAKSEARRLSILALAASTSDAISAPEGWLAGVTLLHLSSIASAVREAREARTAAEKDAHWSMVALNVVYMATGSLQGLNMAGPLAEAQKALAEEAQKTLQRARAAQAASVAVRTGWHDEALARCQARRTALPHIPTTTLADEVRAMGIGAPSADRVRKTIEKWEGQGMLARRATRSL